LLDSWNRHIERANVEIMSVDHVGYCVSFGESNASGQVNWVEKNHTSPVVRKDVDSRKREWGQHTDVEKETKPQHLLKSAGTEDRQQDTLDILGPVKTKLSIPASLPTYLTSSSPLGPDLNEAHHKIIASDLSAFRKRVLTTLLQVPRGQYTTYAAISNSLNSSARAIGNAMRNNPFAPTVPCHRVLAADRTIGGYKGDWGSGNRMTDAKIRLLREEGVRFDGRGKAVGSPWTAFRLERLEG
jgi:methylated-DNA-[protein]-cysteine S-methyltransferase